MIKKELFIFLTTVQQFVYMILIDILLMHFIFYSILLVLTTSPTDWNLLFVIFILRL